MPPYKAHPVNVSGFRATGLACGIKANGKPDLALIVSDTPAVAAGVFTKNRVRAPSVFWCESVLKKGRDFRAIIVNSGNANACTGPQGAAACRTVADRLARELSIRPENILMSSTGIIGVPLPTAKIADALQRAVRNLSGKKSGWQNAATAIMTTDLVPKSAQVCKRIAGVPITLGGISKGSGMIHPNMATMLAYVCTDAVIDAPALKTALRLAVDKTFNSITVDGDTSTNDSLICLANGHAKNRALRPGTAAFAEFVAALTETCLSLACQIVQDGEGATKFVTVRVVRAKTPQDARKVADTVATSCLVKTALFGEDPNWGRILCAVGSSGASFNPQKVGIALNSLPLVKNGVPAGGTAKERLRKQMRNKIIRIDIDLNAGRAETEKYTCDLSYDYVRINAEYTT
jgi:glutamate N-acetyltransferase/amino-acid N-acetyltransferase